MTFHSHLEKPQHTWIRPLWRDRAKAWTVSARATTTLPSSRQTAGPSTGPSPTSSGRLLTLHKYLNICLHSTKQPFTTGTYFLCFFFLQEEHSEVSWSGERHLYSEGHAETRRYHPLCVWSPQHHKHLRESLPSFANCVPHEEPTSQALRYCGKLRDPVEQQLRTRDWLSRLCYQVLLSSSAETS